MNRLLPLLAQHLGRGTHWKNAASAFRHGTQCPTPKPAQAAGALLATPEIVLFLLGITKDPAMATTSVTSKGQVIIPKPLRQQLGLRQGSKVEFVLVGERVEMRIVSTPAVLPASGFGMLRSKRVAVPVDFDPAGLLARSKTGRSK